MIASSIASSTVRNVTYAMSLPIVLAQPFVPPIPVSHSGEPSGCACEQQRHISGILEEARGHCFQNDVQSGTGGCGVVRTALGDAFGKVHAREEERLGGSAGFPRPGIPTE